MFDELCNKVILNNSHQVLETCPWRIVFMDELQVGKSGGDDADKPIPFDDGGVEVLHSPLNLGGGAASGGASKKEASSVRPVVKDTVKRVSWPDRITGVKTFYTKLHPGAMEFLDEQVCNWLRDNPGVNAKWTNIVIGDVAAKKTEPNIIMSVWY